MGLSYHLPIITIRLDILFATLYARVYTTTACRQNDQEWNSEWNLKLFYPNLAHAQESEECLPRECSIVSTSLADPGSGEVSTKTSWRPKVLRPDEQPMSTIARGDLLSIGTIVEWYEFLNLTSPSGSNLFLCQLPETVESKILPHMCEKKLGVVPQNNFTLQRNGTTHAKDHFLLVVHWLFMRMCD